MIPSFYQLLGGTVASEAFCVGNAAAIAAACEHWSAHRDYGETLHLVPPGATPGASRANRKQGTLPLPRLIGNVCQDLLSARFLKTLAVLRGYVGTGTSCKAGIVSRKASRLRTIVRQTTS